MRVLLFAAALSCCLLLAPSRSNAQSDLDQLDKKFIHYFEKVMPGWKHERGEPFGKSENVLIQFWYSSDTSVKISVVMHHSGNEARDALEQFARTDPKRQTLKNIGDEAYAVGFAQSNIVLRKGKCVIYVSARADAPAELKLIQEQRLEFEKKEMQRWSKEFAKHAADAADGP